jgi:hypothetical protein
VGHVVLEGPVLLQGQIRPRQSGEDPTQDEEAEGELEGDEPAAQA